MFMVINRAKINSYLISVGTVAFLFVMAFVNLYYVEKFGATLAVASVAAILSTLGFAASTKLYVCFFESSDLIISLSNIGIVIVAITGAVSVLLFFLIEAVYRHKSKKTVLKQNK
jgi:hypothetical protein